MASSTAANSKEDEHEKKVQELEERVRTLQKTSDELKADNTHKEEQMKSMRDNHQEQLKVQDDEGLEKDDRIHTLEEENRTLTITSNTKEAAANAVRTRNEARIKELEDAETEKDSKITRYEATIKDLRQEVKDLEANEQVSQRQIEDLAQTAARLGQVQRERDDAIAARTAAEADAAQARAAAETLVEELRASRAEVAALAARPGSTISLGRAPSTIGSPSPRPGLSTLDAEMLEGENADLKEEVEELKAQIASAEAASDTLRTEVDGLKAQLANAETTSDTIRAERDEAQRRLADITRQLRDMTSARDKLQGQLTALQTRERELQARLTSRGTGASSPAGAVTAALEDCEREKGVLSSRLAEIEEKLARKKKEHEDKFNKLKEEMDDPARKNFDQEKKDLELRITELEELLKAEQDDHKDTAEQLEDCRRHRGGDEDLKKKVEELEREIQALKKRARELEHERDRMRSHRDQHQKERDRMEEELVREMDKRRQLEARIAELEGRIVDSAARIVELEAQLAAKEPDDDRIAELERRIAELIQSRLDLIEYFTNKMKEIEDNSRRYQAIRDERLAEFERERDQFARQMGTVRDRINANPGAPDVGNYQRRSEFLQAEIKKLQDRIKTLKDERVWFEDLAITSQEAQERAEEAVVEAREALDEARRELQDRNRIGIANARRQRDDAAAPEPPAPQPRWFPWYLRPDSWGYTNLGWNRRTARLLYEPFLMFVVISIGIAFGREYATWQNANDYQRRALYAMHKERYTVCLVTPDWYLLWEFFAVILTGSWAWSAI